MTRSRLASRAQHDPDWAARRRAQAYLAVYLSRGKIVAEPCGCGAAGTIAIQDDPRKPQRVRWVCRPCAARPPEDAPAASPLDDFIASSGGIAAALDRLLTLDPAVLAEISTAALRAHRFLNAGSPLHRQATLKLAFQRGLL